MAHNLLAGALGQQGDLIGARDHIDKSLQIKSNYAGARYNLGLMLLQQRDFAKAQEQFILALQASKQDPMIWNALGVAQVNLGRIDEAISNYRQYLELNPNYADAFAKPWCRTSVRRGNTPKRLVQTAIRLRPGVADTHANLAAALWNIGRGDESILQNRKALELNPALLDPRLNLGIALFAKRHYDEAICQLEYVLRLNPQHEMAQKVLAAARRKRDETTTKP